MAKLTKTQQVINKLLELGYTETQTGGRKHRCFTHPKMSEKVFVGNAGAVRIGRCITQSFSHTERFHAKYAIK